MSNTDAVTSNETASEAEVLRAQLEKLQRRQQRNFRAHFARGLMQGILSMLRPGDIVLDCGANVGDVSEPLARTGATVHAFEPDPYAYENLKKRMKGFENVTLHNAAVGVTSGSIRLMRANNFDDNPRSGSVKSTVIPGGRKIDEAEGAGIDVALISLPEFVRDLLAENDEIAFLKMDIEGAELDLLEHFHSENLFTSIRLTVAETHENKFRELRPRFKALRKAVTAEYPITKVNLDWI